jgi:hypothetical protein
LPPQGKPERSDLQDKHDEPKHFALHA